MSTLTAQPEDEAAAINRMLDDGAPNPAPPSPRTRRSRWAPLVLPDEPTPEERVALRRAARTQFRVYCIACGRSTDVSIAPQRPGRCLHCGGTMQVEYAAD